MPTPRKPAAVKRLAGNPGKRKIADEPDTGQLAKLPRCPEYVTGEGRRLWARLGATLLAAGLLMRADLAAFGGLCVEYGRWVDAEQHVAREGAVIRLANGTLARNAWVGISNEALDRLTVLLREFGGTPAARTRVALAAKTDAGAESLADILFGPAVEKATAELGHDDGR